jgi:hypothetical protein
MHHPTTTRPVTREREFVLGPERARITILTTGAETDGRHDLVDSVFPAGSATPLHLHTHYEERVYVISGSLAGFAELVARTGTPGQLVTPETQPDFDRFMAVTTELGDAVLGPPGATPAEVDKGEGAS